ncbi:MAG: MFS transporter [Fimbriimonadaceae bacterium]
MTTDEAHGSTQRHATPLVYGYFVLLMALELGPEKLSSTPLKFIYKDQLHLDAQGQALLGALIAIPGYLAFAFGLFRDRFNPLKLGDRGYLLVFGSLIGLVFLAISQAPLTITSLATGLLIVSAGQMLVRAAYQALMRNISERRMMSGRMSATYQLMVTTLPMAATVAGGWLTEHQVSWRTILVGVGVGYLGLAAFGLWRPTGVFEDVPLSGSREPSRFWQDVQALMRVRAFWLAAAIWGLWAFSPGANTPILYYMTNSLKMNATQYSVYDGLTTLTLVPTVLLFGLLVKRFSLWRLVVIATVVAIPQMIPLMLIHNAAQSFAAATFMGLTGGLANAAYWTLVLRASPKNLAGVGMLMAISFGFISMKGSDVLGGWIFKHWGFSGCAWVTTAVYLLLIPLIFLLPRALVEPRDDERV